MSCQLSRGASRFQGWRQCVGMSAVARINSILRSIALFCMAFASFEVFGGLVLVAIAVSEVARCGIIVSGCTIIAAMAMWIWWLNQECNQLRARCDASNSEVMETVSTQTEEPANVGTSVRPATSKVLPDDTVGAERSVAKGTPAAAAIPQPATALGPSTPAQSAPSSPAVSRCSSISERPQAAHQSGAAVDSTTESASALCCEPTPTTSLLPAVNLSCKVQSVPRPKAAAAPDTQPPSPAGPSTPTRACEPAATAATTNCSAKCKLTSPALPPPAPAPAQPAISSNSAAPKPGLLAPPPPPGQCPPALGPKLQQPAAGIRPPPPLPAKRANVAIPSNSAAGLKPIPGKFVVNNLPAGISKASEVAVMTQKAKQRELKQAGVVVARGGSKVATALAAAAAAGGQVDTKAAGAAVFEEMLGKLGTTARVAASYTKHRPMLVKAVAAIKAFKPETPEALVQFVKEHDQVLADLGDDERAVLNTFGEWPEERYALLQEVAAAHNVLKSRLEQANSWVTPAGKQSHQLSDVRGNIQKLFMTIEAIVVATNADTSKLVMRCKDAKLPWAAQHIKPLVDAIKVASLNLARGYMTASMQQVSSMGLPGLGPAAEQHRQQKRLDLLGQTVKFIGSVYMFVGGFDEATRVMFGAMTDMWEQVADGSFQTQQQQVSHATAQQQKQQLRIEQQVAAQ